MGVEDDRHTRLCRTSHMRYEIRKNLNLVVPQFRSRDNNRRVASAKLRLDIAQVRKSCKLCALGSVIKVVPARYACEIAW